MLKFEDFVTFCKNCELLATMLNIQHVDILKIQIKQNGTFTDSKTHPIRTLKTVFPSNYHSAIFYSTNISQHLIYKLGNYYTEQLIPILCLRSVFQLPSEFLKVWFHPGAHHAEEML